MSLRNKNETWNLLIRQEIPRLPGWAATILIPGSSLSEGRVVLPSLVLHSHCCCHSILKTTQEALHQLRLSTRNQFCYGQKGAALRQHLHLARPCPQAEQALFIYLSFPKGTHNRSAESLRLKKKIIKAIKLQIILFYKEGAGQSQ